MKEEFNRSHALYMGSAKSLTCKGDLQIAVYDDKSISLIRNGFGENEIILTDEEVDFLLKIVLNAV